ncbi:MAG: ATPase, T2SS/T4P/T4SS family, partial [Thermodesulfobacteriota bacterium]
MTEHVEIKDINYPISNDVPELSFVDFPKRPYICEGLSVKFLKNKALLPAHLEDNTLTLIVEDPEDVDTLDAVRVATGFDLKIFKGKREEIERAIDKYYVASNTVNEIVGGIAIGENGTFAGVEEDVDHLRDMASEAPIVRLVNLIITKAIESRASDIHIEPFENTLRVRYRIDDILQEVESLPRHLHAAVTSRIKIMAYLNIAERRLPQDGRIKMRVSGHDVDFRVATIPTAYGESVVLRILDRSNLVLSLEELGFTGDNKKTYEKMISRPYGMILVTGPTGSGKTTSLYATLEKLNSPKKKILTIEDPVEYHLNGVNQIQVKPQIGLTIANGIRHIVRQDPNIIMVGEIRDRETAEIAVHSALTGHLVFSTLHTNDASGAIARLLEMGVEDYLLASSLIGIIAQRLVRIVCDQCKVPIKLDKKGIAKFGDFIKCKRNKNFFKGQCCEECASSGYNGRIGIFEILPI